MATGGCTSQACALVPRRGPRLVQHRLSSHLRPVEGSSREGQPEEAAPDSLSRRTQALFGDEWQRFPELLRVHADIFQWYFEGDGAVASHIIYVLMNRGYVPR